jgi:hypothetical protein
MDDPDFLKRIVYPIGSQIDEIEKVVFTNEIQEIFLKIDKISV